VPALFNNAEKIFKSSRLKLIYYYYRYYYRCRYTTFFLRLPHVVDENFSKLQSKNGEPTY